MKTIRLLVLIALIACFTAAANPAGPVEATIGTHKGRPQVFIDGEPIALTAFSPCALAERIFRPGVKAFDGQDLDAYFLSVPQIKGGKWGDTQFWIGDRVSSRPLTHEIRNVSFADQVELIRRQNPDAWFIIRNGPASSPASWRKLHPDQLFVTADGRRLPHASLASDLYWEELAEAARAAVRYCENQPWSDRIIGYWFGMNTEGTYPPAIRHHLFDHSEVMLHRWRRFLKEKYKTPEQLREAYGDPDLTFGNAPLPKSKLNGPYEQVAETNYWLPREKNVGLRDYLRLVARLVHEGYRRYMAAMREGLGDRKRFLVYDAFKQSMLGWDNLGFFDPQKSWKPIYPALMAGSGHMNVADLFDAKGFDGIITPHDYQARGIGGVYEPEGIVDSAVLRGKYFLCEMDTRTFVQEDSDRYGLAENIHRFKAITWRNVATSITRGFTSYYMELYTPWFTDAGIQEVIERQVDVVHRSLDWEHRTVPGIAVILDDTAVLETNGSGHYFNEALMWATKMGLARCGVPYRLYLLDDLRLENFPDHAVYYFPNLFRVTEERLALLKRKVFRDGNAVVWGPGSGISNGQDLGTDSAEHLTGFRFHPLIPSNYPRRTLITNFDHPLTEGLSADTVIGGPLAYGPVLHPADGTSLGLAWTKQGRNLSGLSVKEFGEGARGSGAEGERGEGDWASVFTWALPLPADLWRNLARHGGAHVYSKTNDVLMADSSVVALHSIRSGEKTLHLPHPSRVRDLITGEQLEETTDTIRFDLQAPATRLFHVQPAK